MWSPASFPVSVRSPRTRSWAPSATSIRTSMPRYSRCRHHRPARLSCLHSPKLDAGELSLIGMFTALSTPLDGGALKMYFKSFRLRLFLHFIRQAAYFQFLQPSQADYLCRNFSHTGLRPSALQAHFEIIAGWVVWRRHLPLIAPASKASANAAHHIRQQAVFSNKATTPS